MVFITSTKRHADYGRLEKIRPHVENRAHQETASAAAFDDQAIFRAVSALDQIFGARDEVGKGGLLVHHAAGIVPGLAHLAATANVRHRDHHSRSTMLKILELKNMSMEMP